MRVFLVLACLAGAAHGGELRGPDLAAASNFGQGWRPDIFAAAQALGVTDFRDAVYWDLVEQGEAYVFDQPTTVYPDRLPGIGAGMSLTVNNGHRDYEDGKTPLGPEAVAAFAAHAAATVQRFPAIHSVEVGNEFNSETFVSGPLRGSDLETRAEAYLALLRATYGTVKAARPEVRILGGGVHSIPVGYLRLMFDKGAAAYMDAIALHPYDTPAEQLVRQVEVLRTVVGDLPLEMTEFGDPNPETAPDHLLRNYCQMALAGTTRAVWYALNVRGDGLESLVDAEMRPTPVSETYRFLQESFAGVPVRPFRPDPFTYGCDFGDHLVVWGAEREMAVAEGLEVRDARARATRAAVGAEAVVVSGESAAEGVLLAPQSVLADSFDQFAYPGLGVDGFERFARIGDRVVPFETLPGQHRQGVPWVPYLGTVTDPGLRLMADTLLPSGGGAQPVEIVHAYVSETEMEAVVSVMLHPAARSEDGVTVRITQDGAVLTEAVAVGRWDWETPVRMAEGTRLEIAVGPNQTARGDVTAYRITISEP